MMSAGHGQVERAIAACALRSRCCGLSMRMWLVWCLAWTLPVCLGGCARFPAIDPNGQSIFLPHPASTELTLPQIHAGNGNPGIIPQDAYPTPLPPPACIDGSCNQPGGIQNLFQHHRNKKQAIANHFAKKDPSRCGQIQLTPTRIVAPVNGEVVLLAGICGKDGYLLKREPLEWMLAPGSVGQFIEVGDDNKGRLCSAFPRGPKVEKLGVDYARGRTSSKATLLTKGSPECADDLEVLEGQTWLSISSPNEGVSKVTVLAPDSELWDKRRQTATIYWVDSQATFPDPIRISNTVDGVLTTRVTSAENMKPATGWQVHYTILDPTIANFVKADGNPLTDANTIITTVDGNGMATVRVRPRGPVGVTPVHIEVRRPMQAAENLPELILHQADTFVTVSAPGLDVNVTGPNSASVNDIVDFVASLGNPGDLNAENARLLFFAPTGTTIVEVQPIPPTTTVPGALEWNQGVLEAGRQVNILIKLNVGNTPGPLNLRFVGQANGLEKTVNRELMVVAPSVDLSVIRKPENTTGQAEVNEVVFYEVGVKNTGTSVLTNLTVQLETSAGWREANQNQNSVKLNLEMLQPGQVVVLPLALRVIQEGPHTAQVTVLNASGQALTQSPTIGVTGTPPRARRPAMEAEIRLPVEQVQMGSTTRGLFRVTNTGETVLENIEVVIQHDAALQAIEVDIPNGPYTRLENATTLRWRPISLQPNQVAQLEVNFLAKGPPTDAGIGMNAVSGQTVDNATNRIRIVDAGGSVLPPGTGGGVNPPGTAPQARTGNWQVLVEAMQGPLLVGNQERFFIEVRNNQNLQDTNMMLKFALPEGIKVINLTRGGSLVRLVQPERGVWAMEQPERFVRPGEALTYYLVVEPTVPQEGKLSVAVSSESQPTPSVQSRTFVVNPR